MAGPARQSPPPPGGSRFLFIDLVRGLAVLVMIETHVVNALLQKPLKDQPLFAVLTFINGLVAPSFLFCAGFALAISLSKRWADFLSLRPPFWRYLLRLLFILVVAYSLHLPFFSLHRLRELTDEKAWVSFFQVDILQVIAVTLMALAWLAVLLRSRRRFAWATAGLALALVFLAPVIREMNLAMLPVWLWSYFTTQFKSQFPLVPWGAFLMSGTLAGYLFLLAREKNQEAEFVRNLAAGALVLIVLALLAEFQPLTVYPNHNFWRASPEFFFVRLGLVLVLTAGLWRYEQQRGASRHSVLALFGRESLLVYVVHLLVVYGYTYEFSFVRMFGPTLGYGESLALFAGLTAAMYGMAFVWHWMKTNEPRVATAVEVTVLAAIVLVFLLKKT